MTRTAVAAAGGAVGAAAMIRMLVGMGLVAVVVGMGVVVLMGMLVSMGVVVMVVFMVVGMGMGVGVGVALTAAHMVMIQMHDSIPPLFFSIIPQQDTNVKGRICVSI